MIRRQLLPEGEYHQLDREDYRYIHRVRNRRRGRWNSAIARVGTAMALLAAAGIAVGVITVARQHLADRDWTGTR